MVMDTNISTAQARSSEGARIINDGDKSSDGPGPAIMDAKTLTGDGVVNTKGEDLGKIEAIMLDVASGHIAYAVLSFGGFLGMGTKLFALPWAIFTLDAGEKRFILDVSKEKLESAEGFDKDRWPSMADPEWATRLHTYYGVTPYWRSEYPTADPRRSVDSTAGTNRTERTGY